MREEFEIVRDILDLQLVDRDKTKMGRVDGLVLAVDDGQQPRIDHFELGFASLARRIHPILERWLQALRERWSVRRSARQIVPWSKVMDVTDDEIQIDVKAEETPAFDWERWLRDKIVKKIPGSGADD